MAVRALLLLLLLVVAAVSGGPRGLAGLGDDDYGPPESDNDFGAGQDGGAAVCPHRCVCRFDASPKHVDCSGKKLKEFPLFEEIPEDVEFLDLSDNEIRSVPRDLPEWPRLERLSLAGNLLEDFPPRTLASLSALEELDLSRNIIPSLRHIKPDRFIVNNHLLQVLNLSGNGLQDLGHGSFQSLSSQSLAVLDVSNCSVSSIDGQEALAELPALHTLRVNINPLQSLPPLRAPALRVLDLSDCRLRAVTERALAALPGLKQLAVNRNPDLGHILPPVPTTPDPDQLGQLTNSTSMWLSSLDTLEAEDCSLHDTAFLEAMPKLTVLRLRGNRISTLEPLGLLGNGALVQLDLADNKIEELPPQALKGTELLKELDLSGNRLTAIHSETFVQHNSLRRLNVSRNPLASLQLNALGLRVLDASGAQLQVLPSGMLDGTPQLRHMNLSNNPLPALPDRIASPGLNAELQFLDLSHCRLTDISTTALNGLPELQALDLIGNRLTEPLKVDAFKENVALNLIQLDDNPWRCDCRGKDYQAFVDFLQAHPAKEDVHALTCFSPEAAQGKTWYDACLGPNAGSLASLDRWMFIAILAVSVALVGGGVFLARRYTRSKALRRRQRRQEQDDERRACEQEAAQRRLHRRMQLQQQEELRRQNVRAQTVSAEDPDPHPPSYEEVVLMDRMTAEQNDHASGSDSDSEDGDSDRFKLELQRKMVLMSSAGRGTDVIEEEEEEGTVASTRAGNQSNGSARKFDTRL